MIVDLAAEAGGNCELTKPGETYTTDGGVKIAGPLNLPSEMAEHASALYARNILALIELGFDFDDEVVKGACVVREGKVVSRVDLLTELAILVLAAFVGFEVISKVPNTLHTPLMSGTNAIHGIVVLGGLLLIGQVDGVLNDFLLVIAIAFGTINVIGGFLVTDRMLAHVQGQEARPEGMSRADVINLLYIVAFSMFIVGLQMLRGPRTAVRGNQVAAVGMAIAVGATLLQQGVGDWG